MDFIIKFAQAHLSFRIPEIESLALVEGIELAVLDYNLDSPFCVVRLPSVEAARRLIRRSVLAQSIHELLGSALTIDELHLSMQEKSAVIREQYQNVAFKYEVDSFRGSRSSAEKLAIMNSLSYLGLEGPIRMSNPDETFTIFEVWPIDSFVLGIEKPTKIYFGRFLSESSRDIILKFDLKKRGYISTTSMDSELALITANIALASPGKLFYDPFVGTGSFPLACAHFGAVTWGSDIDGRAIRGVGGSRSLQGNFLQYDLSQYLGDMFCSDLTNTPIRRMTPTWDGIVCDPPYGVREGLRVLGLKDPEKTPWLVEKGIKHALSPDYIPPKKPYSFLAMLDDILVFAVDTLVEGGRLSFWMPSANDEDLEIPVPQHPCLAIVSVCTQAFNKWSRKLITYRRLPESEVSRKALDSYISREQPQRTGTTADELNPFRKGYFNKFANEKRQIE